MIINLERTQILNWPKNDFLRNLNVTLYLKMRRLGTLWPTKDLSPLVICAVPGVTAIASLRFECGIVLEIESESEITSATSLFISGAGFKLPSLGRC